MSGSSAQGINPLWIAGMYMLVIVVLMAFLIIISVVSDNAKYSMSWIPDVAKTTLDLMKVLVGAVVGALTPAAINKAAAAR
jgi:hypothetical protein